MSLRNARLASLLLIVVIGSLLRVSCTSYRWSPSAKAYAWSSDNMPISVQWIGTGFELWFGHGIYWKPRSGFFRYISPDGQSHTFTIKTSHDMGVETVYLEGLAERARWYRLVDEKRLIIISSFPTSDYSQTVAYQDIAFLYDLDRQKLLFEIPLPLPGRPDVDVDISDDMALMATAGKEGLSVWDLKTGHQNRYLEGHRIRQPRFSRDGKHVAAIVRTSEHEVLCDTDMRDPALRFRLKDDKFVNGARNNPTETFYRVQVVGINATTGRIEQCLSAADIKPWAFTDQTYTGLRPLEWPDQARLLSFYYAPNNTLHLLDKDRISHMTNTYIVDWGPYVSPDSKKLGFFRAEEPVPTGSHRSEKLFYYDLGSSDIVALAKNLWSRPVAH